MEMSPKPLSLTVPDAAVKTVVFQRTEVLRFRKKPAYPIVRKLLGASFYNDCVLWESRNDADRIKRFYADAIAREFSTIERYLPASADSVLDIGCGVAESNIHLVETTKDNLVNIRCGIDVVISLISWGFHYPVETCLDRVHEMLNPGGRLILDVRKQTGGVE